MTNPHRYSATLWPILLPIVAVVVVAGIMHMVGWI